MVVNNKAEVYMKQKVESMKKEELTLMLFEGVVRFLTVAKIGLKENNFEKTSNNIIKAEAIIQELNSTLDMKIPIAQNYRLLYDYMYTTLVDANITKDVQYINIVLELMIDLKDTWREVFDL